MTSLAVYHAVYSASNLHLLPPQYPSSTIAHPSQMNGLAKGSKNLVEVGGGSAADGSLEKNELRARM